MGSELRPLMRLAIPVILAELGWMGMGVVDTIMVGRLGAEAIGAVAIGNVIFSTIGLLCFGLLLGLDTLISQAVGARDFEDAKHWFRQGLWLAAFVSPLLLVTMWCIDPVLDSWGLDPNVLMMTKPFVFVLAISVIPLSFYTAQRRYLQSLHIVQPVTFTLISANVVNAALNWVLIPEYGVRGSAWSTVMARVYMAVALAVVLLWKDKSVFAAEWPDWGIFGLPIMVLTIGDARMAAGWLLPILCCADLFAVYYWRRHAAANRLFALMPWVLAGVVLGAFTLTLPEKQIRPLVGAIIFLMLCLYLWRRRQGDNVPAAHPLPYGISAGFATTVANAAGPVMSLYLLSKRLPKEEFVATGAWFFFFINLVKVPIYVYQGLISKQSLLFGIMVSPAVFCGALAGRWLISRIPTAVFEWSVIVLTAISTVLLLR